MILKVRLSMARPSFSARGGADPFGPPNARTQKAIPWLLPALGSLTGILPHLIRVQPRSVRDASVQSWATSRPKASRTSTREQGVAPLGFVDVELGRRHVIVDGERDRRAARKKLGGVGD